jgi:hypothetical protein
MTWRIDRNAVAVREARGSSILSRRLRCQGGHRCHLGERALSVMPWVCAHGFASGIFVLEHATFRKINGRDQAASFAGNGSKKRIANRASTS